MAYHFFNKMKLIMVAVAQLVRAAGCGPAGRGFESLRSPIFEALLAQLDRALDFGSSGWGFDSLRGHNNLKKSAYYAGFLISMCSKKYQTELLCL